MSKYQESLKELENCLPSGLIGSNIKSIKILKEAIGKAIKYDEIVKKYDNFEKDNNAWLLSLELSAIINKGVNENE